jgi:D-hydroxyproline dehydrogenase subunit beta
MTRRADVAVIGGGIVGLAAAWAAVRRGRSVVLFERSPRADGASVRNFGMIWPIGQPPGELHRLALRSRELWLEAVQQAELWCNPCGSLHLAYHPDEWAVLQEFVAGPGSEGYGCKAVGPDEARRYGPAVKTARLFGALWSPVELCIEPRQAVARLTAWLRDVHGVQTHHGTAVTSIEMPFVRTAAGERWEADRVLVCGGADFETLFPQVFAEANVGRCKLQMMRTLPQPSGWRLGPHLAGGLTLCHYAAFRACPSLPSLRARIETEYADHVRLGIHVMASQNHLGEVVIGDSHEYGDALSPFDRVMIDELILNYLRNMVDLPDWSLGERWHGVYAKHPTEPLFTAEPQPRCHVLSSPGGAGMTLSLAWAEQLLKLWDA